MRLLTQKKALVFWNEILAVQTESSSWDSDVHTVQTSKILLSSCNKKQLRAILKALCLQIGVDNREYVSKSVEFNLECFKSRYENLLDIAGNGTQSLTDIIVLRGKTGFLSSRLFKGTHTGASSKNVEEAKVTLTDLPEPTLVILDKDVTQILNSKQPITAESGSKGILSVPGVVVMEPVSEVLETKMAPERTPKSKPEQDSQLRAHLGQLMSEHVMLLRKLNDVMTGITALLNEKSSKSGDWPFLGSNNEPPKETFKTKKQHSKHSKRRCYSCRERGHSKRDCPQRKQNKNI